MGKDISPPPLSLYIHIPFCLSRCGYCSFFSVPFSRTKLDEYLSHLLLEKDCYKKELESPLLSVYFGGGSPSLLNEAEINLLMQDFNLLSDAEISLELNPIQITPPYLSLLSHTRVNRLSIGLQSMIDLELKWLDRRHSAASMPDRMKLCREFGYDNISMDLIYGLPGSTLRTLNENLDLLCSLNPDHISCYLLGLDEDCARYKDADRLPDEDMQFGQYELIRQKLTANGFVHYEISSFTKPGKESVHNLAYWHCNNYLALGASAAGWMAPIRYQNASELGLYYLKTRAGKKYPNQSINDKQRMVEDYLMMGLRLIEGIKLSEYRQRFGEDIDAVYGERIQRLISIGMLKRDCDHIALTDEALFVSNSVIADLML